MLVHLYLQPGLQVTPAYQFIFYLMASAAVFIIISQPFQQVGFRQCGTFETRV